MAHETDKKLDLVFTQLEQEERENIARMLEQAAAAIRADNLDSSVHLQASASQGIGRLRFLRELSPTIQNRLAIVDAPTPAAKVSLVRETPKIKKIEPEKPIEEAPIQQTVSLVRETPKAKREPKENKISIVDLPPQPTTPNLEDQPVKVSKRKSTLLENRYSTDLNSARQEKAVYALLEINETGDNFKYPEIKDSVIEIYRDLSGDDPSPIILNTNKRVLLSQVLPVILYKLPRDISPNQSVKNYIRYFQEWFNWIGNQPAYKDLSRENLINILQRSEGENTFRRFVLGITEENNIVANPEIKQPEVENIAEPENSLLTDSESVNQEKVKGSLGVLSPAHWAVLASSILYQSNTQEILGVQLDKDTKKVFEMIQEEHLRMIPATPENLKKVKAEVYAYLEHFQSQPEETLKTLDENDQYQEILMMFYGIKNEQLAKLFT